VSDWSMSVALVRRVLLSVPGGRYSEQMASLKEGRYMHVAQASLCVGRVMAFVGILLKAWMDVPPPPSSRSVLVTGGQRASASGWHICFLHAYYIWCVVVKCCLDIWDV
jgi:hypothetical protein